MVDDEARIGVAVDQRRARIHVAPAQYVNRKVVLYGRAQDPVEARVIRLALRLLRHHDADADRARCLLPVGDDTGVWARHGCAILRIVAGTIIVVRAKIRRLNQFKDMSHVQITQVVTTAQFARRSIGLVNSKSRTKAIPHLPLFGKCRLPVSMSLYWCRCPCTNLPLVQSARCLTRRYTTRTSAPTQPN